MCILTVLIVLVMILTFMNTASTGILLPQFGTVRKQYLLTYQLHTSAHMNAVKQLAASHAALVELFQSKGILIPFEPASVPKAAINSTGIAYLFLSDSAAQVHRLDYSCFRLKSSYPWIPL